MSIIYPIVKRPHLQQPPIFSKLNTNSIGADAVVGCWVMNATAGKRVIDYGPYGITGEFSDPTTTTMQFDRNKVGNGLSFNGDGSTAEHLSLGTLANTHPASLSTVESFTVLIRLSNRTNEGLLLNPRVFEKKNGGIDGWSLHFNVPGSRFVYIGDREGQISTIVTPNGLMNLEETNNLAFTFRRTGVALGDTKYFENGNLILEQTNISLSMPGNTSGPAGIGGRVTATNANWKGVIECFVLFDRELSNQELCILTKDPYTLFDFGPTGDQFIGTEFGSDQKLFVVNN